ncbi:MAG TPA: tetratricopeptide repeat protein [Chloroflexia bacterium]|nr:tetratricopeptide repeat protein [Chloroflexia bacterium]
MNVQTPFPIWLKQRRRALDLRQEDLAERIGCSASTIRKFELGERRPSRQIAELLVVSLGVPPEERAAFISFARGQGSMPEPPGTVAVPVAAHATNLPISLTPLIGREREIEAIHRLLVPAKVRMLTLTGPPGIGKTSLSLQVAHDIVDSFRDGVYFVALAAIVEPDLVIVTIAHALGVQQKATESLLRSVQQAVGGKEILLLLDNFEQVLDASPAVLELLGACSHLKILVTSREALHVQGERQFQVPVLETADPQHLPPLDVMRDIPAVALFIERAQEVKPDFVLREQNAEAVAAICASLDGLPLAIELAAARIRLFSPQEMQARLQEEGRESRLMLLTGGPRNLPARQRTLRAAIGWSYNLLSKSEQTLFARLGVFVGGCTLAAAAAICNPQDIAKAHAESDPSKGSGREQTPVYEMQEKLESLLDKNLVKREDGVAAASERGEETEGESRFNMLELVREYSLERLRASGEEEDIRRLHAEYYLDMAEVGEHELGGIMQKLWLRKLAYEHDNIRSALRWLINTGQATLALRLSGAMRTFWQVRGHNSEGLRWLEEAIRGGTDVPAYVRAKALRSMGHLAQFQGEYGQVSEWLEESLALYRKLGDVAGILGALRTLAFSLILQGDLERAIALCKEGLALAYGPVFQVETARLLYVTGAATWYKGDFVQAEEFTMQGVALSRQQGDADMTAAGLNLLGLIAHYRGDHDGAKAFYDQSLSIARQLGFQQNVAHVYLNSGDLALLQGEPERAAPLMREGLMLFVELGDKQGITEGLEGMACLASAMKQPERAVCLFGAAAALRAAVSMPLPTFVRALYERNLAESRCQMDEEAFTKAWAEGRAMPMEQVIEYALADVVGLPRYQ